MSGFALHAEMPVRASVLLASLRVVQEAFTGAQEAPGRNNIALCAQRTCVEHDGGVVSGWDG